VQRGEKAGFLHFKGRARYHSFTYKEYGDGARLDNGVLVLSKIGRIAVHWSRPIVGAPKTVTLCKEADGWNVAISCAEVPTHPLPATGQETGIDLELESFATLADGTRILTPGCYRNARAYLAKCQRRVSRRKKGSQRRRKAVCVPAKAHQTVRRQGQDFHHKTALSLVRQYDTIYHEDLRVANLVRIHRLAKSSSDAGWGTLLTILTFKAESARKQAQAVNPAFTSQTRSGCGVVVPKGLSVRWRACPECGTSPHRDHNAAKNRERAGQTIWGRRGGSRVGEPRTRRALARAECQMYNRLLSGVQIISLLPHVTGGVMVIRAVVFDIGGILEIVPEGGDPTRRFPDMIARWEERLSLPPGELDKRLTQMDERLSAAGKDGAIGTCTEEEWLAELGSATGMNPSQMNAFMRDFWDVYMGEPNSELIAYFQSLHPRYRTALLSNSFVGARREEEARFGFAAMTNLIVYSHEEGMSKPDQRIYERTWQRLGVQPQEMIFLDDVEPNILAARECGIQAVLFQNNAQAIAEIEAYLRG
jgi:putative transposase